MVGKSLEINMTTKTDELVENLIEDCLYEAQHIPEYTDGTMVERQYFSRGELVDALLIAFKQVRKTDEIPESLEGVKIEEEPKIILLAAATCIRKMASDARSEDRDVWQKEVLGEILADRIKTAEWMEKTAADYEKTAREV